MNRLWKLLAACRSRSRAVGVMRANTTARLLFGLIFLLAMAHRMPAPIFETPEKPPAAPGTSINPDGSRTVYEVDRAHHRAQATVTERDGRLREKILYELDNAGRFTSRTTLDAGGKMRSKSFYRYDKAGRILEETKVGKDDAILHKIAFSYDQSGKQAGYSVFDGNGNLVSQSGAAPPSRTPNPEFVGPPGG